MTACKRRKNWVPDKDFVPNPNWFMNAREHFGPSQPRDIRGQLFHRLEPIEIFYRTPSGIEWLCVCLCGGLSVVRSYNLTSGRIKSCGCFQRERGAQMGKSWKGVSRKKPEPINTPADPLKYFCPKPPANHKEICHG